MVTFDDQKRRAEEIGRGGGTGWSQMTFCLEIVEEKQQICQGTPPFEPIEGHQYQIKVPSELASLAVGNRQL